MSTMVTVSFVAESSSLAVPCDLVIAIDATPTNWAFYFQGSEFPLSMSGTWSGSMCRVHIAFQELQATLLMLSRMTFQLPGKVLALRLYNCTAKAHLCKVVEYLFSFFPDLPATY